MSGSLIGVASTNFAYFLWYSTVRDLYFKNVTVATPPSTAVELALGAVAGALAQLFTIPVSVVTTRQQTQAKGERKGMLDTAQEVLDGEDGVTGLWRGLKASLVLVVNPSITYGAYERLKPLLFPGAVLKPWQAFGTFGPIDWGWGNCADLNSSRSDVKGTCHDSNAATDCRQGWFAVQAASIERRQAFQVLHRSHAIYL